MAKCTDFSASGVLQFDKKQRISFAVASNGSPLSLIIRGFRSEFIFGSKVEIILVLLDMIIDSEISLIYLILSTEIGKDSKQKIRRFFLLITNLILFRDQNSIYN